MSTLPSELNLLTLNCWGLKYISAHRSARLSAIGRALATITPVPHIVGLQECWVHADYLSIRDATRHILPYGKFYHSGFFGGGLVILSKWPIESSSMYRYPLNGRPTAFYRGDWFVGKGVACARIRYGAGVKDVAEVFCTHMHAPYEKEPDDSYLCHRTAQAWEMAKLMRGAAERGHLVVGLGDFNMVPLSFAHQLIEECAPVKDLWRLLHPESSPGQADERDKAARKTIPSAEHSLRENGSTCDSVLNTWRWRKEDQKKASRGQKVVVDGKTPDPKSKRLDYIFVGSSPSNEWRISAAKVGMTERHPTLGCSLSDHFSVEATLSRSDVPSLDCHTLPSPPMASLLFSILPLIDTYTHRQRRQRRFMLMHFIIAFVVSVACCVGIWWSSKSIVSFVLVLVSTLNLGAGIVEGVIGGLFIGSELRALKEFEWEITNAIGEDTVFNEGVKDVFG